jgi:hypothetical protein
MPRTLLAALALACVCSPAMAGTLGLGEPSVLYHYASSASLVFAIAFGILIVLAHMLKRVPPPDARIWLFPLAFMATMMVGPALAAEVATVGNTATILPWGAWLVAAMETIREPLVNIVIVIVTAIVGRLGWFAQMWFTQQRIDRMVRLAADYAINAVAGAVRDQAASVDLAPILLRVGLQRAMGSTEGWVTKAAGGEKGVSERLFRAFHFDETVTDANTLTPFLANLPAAVK